MAPHSPNGKADVTSAHASWHNEAKDVQNEAWTLTLKRKVALCAGLVASESMGLFSSISEMPLQQALGTPVYLLTVPGTVSASTALVLVPLMGWIADGGSRPHQRKKPVTVAAFCLGILGICFNLSAATLAALKSPLQNHTIISSFSIDGPVINVTDLYSVVTLLPGNGSTHSGFEASGIALDDDVSEMATITTEMSVGPAVNGFVGLPLPSILAMAGFIVTDLAFDTSNSAVKALMLTHSPPKDHVSLLVTGVVMAALGGFSTSVTGLVDLGSILPDIDPVCKQAIFQLTTLAILTVLCCTCSVLSASRLSPPAHSPSDPPAMDLGQEENEWQSSEGWEGDTGMTSELIPREEPENAFFPGLTSGEAFMHNSTQLEHSFRRLTASAAMSQSLSLHPHNLNNEKTRFRQGLSGRYDAIPDDEATETAAAKEGALSSMRFKLFVLYLAAFFSGCSIFTFNITIADFLGKVVYGGDPQAEAGSEDYSLYQQGMRTAALCVLCLNVAFVTSALCQNKVLAAISPKAEFVVVSLALMVLLLAMRQTANLWVVYVTAVVVGLCRADLFTVPFVLATQLCCQPFQTEKLSNAEGGKNRDEESSRFGSTMALMTSSVPSAYLVANAIIGPLVDATGDPSAPMLLAIVCTLLAAITICCYKAQR